MTTDTASTLVGAGVAIFLLGVLWVFGPGWAILALGAILLLTGLGIHLNAGKTGEAKDVPVDANAP